MCANTLLIFLVPTYADRIVKWHVGDGLEAFPSLCRKMSCLLLGRNVLCSVVTVTRTCGTLGAELRVSWGLLGEIYLMPAP